MHRIILVSTATAMTMAQALPAVVAAQPTDKMARPAPLPAPEARPTPLPGTVPNRPNRPPGGNNGNNNWNNGNNNWNNGNNNWGGSGGSWNNNNNNWNGGNWSGETIRCESRDGRRHNCRANTNGGVRLVRQLSNTPCVQGRTWGISGGSIWVDNGCRGEFQLRYGSGTSGSSSGGGPSAGAIIGGVAVAGGLIALLSQSGKNDTPPPTAGAQMPPPTAQQPAPPPALPAAPAGPARITAQLGGLTPDARPSMQTCLNEAARQVGATGGTEIRLDRIDDVQPGNGGFRFRFQLVAVYPDETRSIPTFCRATPTSVVELTFG
jgi:hypothetical protein